MRGTYVHPAYVTAGLVKRSSSEVRITSTVLVTLSQCEGTGIMPNLHLLTQELQVITLQKLYTTYNNTYDEVRVLQITYSTSILHPRHKVWLFLLTLEDTLIFWIASGDKIVMCPTLLDSTSLAG